MLKTRMVSLAAQDGAEPTQLAIHQNGRGPLAVLIHGFPLDHRMWLDVMHGKLSERRTLCAIDLRGHGQSPYRGDAVHSMERLADDVAAVIDDLSTEPVDVCGLSMGGYVAFALHARHRERIRSLVLTNTRAAADTDAQRAGRDASIELVRTSGTAAIADAMLPKLLAADAGDEHRARLREMIESLPAESIAADQRGLQQRPDRRPELAGITAPTLVIAGDQDVITPQAEVESMAREIPNGRLQVVRGTGHMSPLENATAWSDAVTTLWS